MIQACITQADVCCTICYQCQSKYYYTFIWSVCEFQPFSVWFSNMVFTRQLLFLGCNTHTHTNRCILTLIFSSQHPWHNHTGSVGLHGCYGNRNRGGQRKYELCDGAKQERQPMYWHSITFLKCLSYSVGASSPITSPYWLLATNWNECHEYLIIESSGGKTWADSCHPTIF